MSYRTREAETMQAIATAVQNLVIAEACVIAMKIT
jgi:hypothetical protein